MAFIDIDPSLDVAEEVADLLMTFMSDSVSWCCPIVNIRLSLSE